MDYLPEKIYLIDIDPHLIQSWKDEFDELDVFEVVLGDYFDIQADCMVSPANSFGVMDGGLDLAISYEFGQSIEDIVQESIITNYHGELPVGSALVVETGNAKWTHLVSAPTMRVPENVSNSVNAYLAFRAILIEVSKYNSKHPKASIKSLVCPGLCTGVGKMTSKNCAVQMRFAYDNCMLPPNIPNLGKIHTNHFKMRSKV